MLFLRLLASSFLLFILPAVAADHQVFAHRGASGYLPEHGYPAKAMAHAQGVDFLEQDVVLTKDGVPIVLHDIHLDGITDVAKRFPDRKRADGRYFAIDFTLEEIRQLQATQRFDPETGKPVYPQRFPLDGLTYRLHTLEEEIRFIHGLNASTGKKVGLFTEIKQPTFHQQEGQDIRRVVSTVLRQHGYGADKDSACWIQCFEKTTLQRLRGELGWKGRLMMIFAPGGKPGADGSDYNALATPAGLKELAGYVDGVFPNHARVVSWNKAGAPVAGTFTRDARASGLRVISGVVNRDALPKNCPSVEAMHEGLFKVAGVDDACTDFPDLTVEWVKENMGR